MRVLIVGCGFVGLPLGAELARLGHEVVGLRRSAVADDELQSAHVQPFHADITRPETLAKLPRHFDWVVNCAAASGGGVEEYRRLYFDGTRHLIEWLQSAPPAKYIYTSSTSVYGQNDGSLVTEADPAEPESETGRILVATEKLLRSAAVQKNFPAVILRASGIYGAGRGYWLRQFLAGEAKIEGDGSRFLNMIHRDDLIGAIIAALHNGRAGSVLNASDCEPASQAEIYKWLAERLGKPLPPVVPESSPEIRRRGATNKRVSNSQLRRELAYEFKYPTFRQGYDAEIVQHGMTAGS